MHLKAINLAMMKCLRTYDAVDRIELPCSGAQASVGSNRYSVSHELMVRSGISR